MSRILFGALGAVAMMATPALAGSGYVGASYQRADIGGSDGDVWSLNGQAALGENFQLGAGYASFEGDLDVWTIGGHLFSRGPQWLWGGYAGFTTFDSSGLSFDEWTIAGETQFYMSRTTLTGVLSYTSSDYIGDLDQWALDGELRHFVSDNFSLQGNVGFAHVSDVDVDGWTAGVGGEFQFDGAPISLYGGYQHADYDGPESDAFTIGARWNFGGQSLFERNRSGASLTRPVGFVDRALATDAFGR